MGNAVVTAEEVCTQLLQDAPRRRKGVITEQALKKLHAPLQCLKKFRRLTYEANMVKDDSDADKAEGKHLQIKVTVEKWASACGADDPDVFLLEVVDGLAARQTMFWKNQRLVASIIKTLWSEWMPYEDVFQEGRMALIRAIDLWDPEMGYRFSTYAHYAVKRKTTRALAYQGKEIRWPEAVWEDVSKLNRAINGLEALGHKSNDEAIRKEMGISQEKLSRLHKYRSQKVVSLDAIYDSSGPDRNPSLRPLNEFNDPDGVFNDDPVNPFYAIERGWLIEEVEAATARLPPLEAEVFRLWRGTDDGVPKSFLRIEAILGERLGGVRSYSVYRRAARKIRKAVGPYVEAYFN